MWAEECLMENDRSEINDASSSSFHTIDFGEKLSANSHELRQRYSPEPHEEKTKTNTPNNSKEQYEI